MTITVQIKRDNDTTGKILRVFTKSATGAGNPPRDLAPGESANFTITAENSLKLLEVDVEEPTTAPAEAPEKVAAPSKPKTR